ncbi:unnamed protein product, partial [Rotaria magnacalcarata]
YRGPATRICGQFSRSSSHWSENWSLPVPKAVEVDSSAEKNGLFQLWKSSMGFIQSSGADRCMCTISSVSQSPRMTYIQIN